jgi:hypothetical protein
MNTDKPKLDAMIIIYNLQTQKNVAEEHSSRGKQLDYQ